MLDALLRSEDGDEHWPLCYTEDQSAVVRSDQINFTFLWMFDLLLMPSLSFTSFDQFLCFHTHSMCSYWPFKTLFMIWHQTVLHLSKMILILFLNFRCTNTMVAVYQLQHDYLLLVAVDQ